MPDGGHDENTVATGRQMSFAERENMMHS